MAATGRDRGSRRHRRQPVAPLQLSPLSVIDTLCFANDVDAGLLGPREGTVGAKRGRLNTGDSASTPERLRQQPAPRLPTSVRGSSPVRQCDERRDCGSAQAPPCAGEDVSLGLPAQAEGPETGVHAREGHDWDVHNHDTLCPSDYSSMVCLSGSLDQGDDTGGAGHPEARRADVGSQYSLGISITQPSRGEEGAVAEIGVSGSVAASVRTEEDGKSESKCARQDAIQRGGYGPRATETDTEQDEAAALQHISLDPALLSPLLMPLIWDDDSTDGAGDGQVFAQCSESSKVEEMLLENEVVMKALLLGSRILPLLGADRGRQVCWNRALITFRSAYEARPRRQSEGRCRSVGEEGQTWNDVQESTRWRWLEIAESNEIVRCLRADLRRQHSGPPEMCMKNSLAGARNAGNAPSLPSQSLGWPGTDLAARSCGNVVASLIRSCRGAVGCALGVSMPVDGCAMTDGGGKGQVLGGSADNGVLMAEGEAFSSLLSQRIGEIAVLAQIRGLTERVLLRVAHADQREEEIPRQESGIVVEGHCGSSESMVSNTSLSQTISATVGTMPKRWDVLLRVRELQQEWDLQRLKQRKGFYHLVQYVSARRTEYQ